MSSITPHAPTHIGQPAETLGNTNNAIYQPPVAPTATMVEISYKPAGNPKLIKLEPPQYYGDRVVDSTLMACPECKENVLTTVKPEVGPKTACASVVYGMFFLPLACIVCFFDNYKDKVHYCHKCGFRFGKLKYINVKPSAASN